MQATTNSQCNQSLEAVNSNIIFRGMLRLLSLLRLWLLCWSTAWAWEWGSSISTATPRQLMQNNKIADAATSSMGGGIMPEDPFTEGSRGNGQEKMNTRNMAFAQLGLDIDGEAPGDFSGHAIALSADGSRVAIGAIMNDPNININSEVNADMSTGHVRVYEWQDNQWIQLGKDLDGQARGDRFGWSVDLNANGTRVVIGGRYNDGNGLDAGHARVYEFNEDNDEWYPLGQDLQGEAAYDQFGFSVAMNGAGNRVTIGAIENDGSAVGAGHVRVYEYDNSNYWKQVGADIDGEAANDQSGWSVDMDAEGNRIVIGARLNDANGDSSGHVRVYQLNNTNNDWEQLGVDLDGEDAVDISGRSVSMSSDGNRIAVGAIGNNGNGFNSGHVRIYELREGAWRQLGADIDGEAREDRSGWSVSMSGDGLTVAIGAPFARSDGSQSGQVRVYQLEMERGRWTQLGPDLEGEATRDQFGNWVALSENAGRLAIGAQFNDGNGTDSGHVRVYSLYEQLNDTIAPVPVVFPTEAPLTEAPLTSPPVPMEDPSLTSPPVDMEEASPTLSPVPMVEARLTSPPFSMPAEEPKTSPPANIPAEEFMTSSPVTMPEDFMTSPPVTMEPANETETPVADIPWTSPPVTSPPSSLSPVPSRTTETPVADIPWTSPPVTSPPSSLSPVPSRTTVPTLVVKTIERTTKGPTTQCVKKFKACSERRRCCKAFTCRVGGNLDRKMCLPQCASKGQRCLKGLSCCEGLVCRFSAIRNRKICLTPKRKCLKISKPCDDSVKCCPGLICKFRKSKGVKACTRKCARGSQRCGREIPCCGERKICQFDEGLGHRICVPPKPKCTKISKPCDISNDIPCCPGLACKYRKAAGANLCTRTCSDKGQRCGKEIPCCGTGQCTFDHFAGHRVCFS